MSNHKKDLSVDGEKLIFSPVTNTDILKIKENYKSFFPDGYYDLSDMLTEEVLNDQDFCKDASFVIKDTKDESPKGIIIAKKVPEAPTYGNIYVDTAWISVLLVREDVRKQGIGSSLLNKSLEALKKYAPLTVFIGQDIHNVFSGIAGPKDWKVSFFEKNGFSVDKDPNYDLINDISTEKLIDEYDTSEFAKDYSVGVIEPENDTEKLLKLIYSDDTLPDRWAFELKEYLDKGGDPAGIVLLKDNSDKSICGFMKVSCKPSGISRLGTVGVDSRLQGRHLGTYFFRETLVYLRNMGARNTLIDWTILVGFYGIFGFKPMRPFIGGYRKL